MNYYYATTVRKVSQPVYISDYNTFLHDLKHKYPKAEVVYHFEEDKGLHVHMMIKTPTRMYINKFHPGRGWNVDHQMVKNLAAWQCYISKASKKENDLILRETCKEQAHALDWHFNSPESPRNKVPSSPVSPSESEHGSHKDTLSDSDSDMRFENWIQSVRIV